MTNKNKNIKKTSNKSVKTNKKTTVKVAKKIISKKVNKSLQNNEIKKNIKPEITDVIPEFPYMLQNILQDALQLEGSYENDINTFSKLSNVQRILFILSKSLKVRIKSLNLSDEIIFKTEDLLLTVPIKDKVTFKRTNNLDKWNPVKKTLNSHLYKQRKIISLTDWQDRLLQKIVYDNLNELIKDTDCTLFFNLLSVLSESINYIYTRPINHKPKDEDKLFKIIFQRDHLTPEMFKEYITLIYSLESDLIKFYFWNDSKLTSHLSDNTIKNSLIDISDKESFDISEEIILSSNADKRIKEVSNLIANNKEIGPQDIKQIQKEFQNQKTIITPENIVTKITWKSDQEWFDNWVPEDKVEEKEVDDAATYGNKQSIFVNESCVGTGNLVIKDFVDVVPEVQFSSDVVSAYSALLKAQNDFLQAKKRLTDYYKSIGLNTDDVKL